MLFGVVGLGLLLTIVPRFLDAIYYRGPVTAHFDGERFKNPDPDDEIRVVPRRPRGSYVRRRLAGIDPPPDWPDHVAIDPMPVPRRVMGQAMVATWVGHATLLVQTNGLNILTDPIWSHRAGLHGIGPGRVAPPAIDFNKLPRIDLVLVSHNHYDHMDLSTLKRLWERDKPVFVTSLGNDSLLNQVGIPFRSATGGPGVQALDWNQLTRLSTPVAAARRSGGRPGDAAPIEVAVTRNHHWSTRWRSDDNRALWSAFVVRLPGGNLFFAGDTGAGDLRWADEAARFGPVRLALIPIGAFRFSPGQMGDWSHIGPVDAVEVARRLGASRSIGMHWGTFRLSNEAYFTPPRLLAAAMACTGQSGRFDTVPLGQPVAIAPYASPDGTPAMSRARLLDCLDTPTIQAMR